MAFRLFNNDPDDPARHEVSFADLDNKAFWCQLGRKKEDAFVAHMKQVQSGCEVCIHPEKDDYPYYPDLLVRQDGHRYPSGHPSCSYVFDLSDDSFLERP